MNVLHGEARTSSLRRAVTFFENRCLRKENKDVCTPSPRKESLVVYQSELQQEVFAAWKTVNLLEP